MAAAQPSFGAAFSDSFAYSNGVLPPRGGWTSLPTADPDLVVTTRGVTSTALDDCLNQVTVSGWTRTGPWAIELTVDCTNPNGDDVGMQIIVGDIAANFLLVQLSTFSTPPTDRLYDATITPPGGAPGPTITIDRTQRDSDLWRLAYDGTTLQVSVNGELITSSALSMAGVASILAIGMNKHFLFDDTWVRKVAVYVPL